MAFLGRRHRKSDDPNNLVWKTPNNNDVDPDDYEDNEPPVFSRHEFENQLRIKPDFNLDLAKHYAKLYPDIAMGPDDAIPQWALTAIRNSGDTGRYLFDHEHKECFHVMPINDGNRFLISLVTQWKNLSGRVKLLHEPLLDEEKCNRAMSIYQRVNEFIDDPINFVSKTKKTKNISRQTHP